MTSRKRPTRQQRGYDADWYALRAIHLAGNPTCGRCGKPATDVDHRIPFNGVADPLRLDAGNLESLCIVCHAKKTADDQRAKPEKQKPGPKPLYTPEEKAERNREANRKQSRKKSREGQDIGELPAVKDPARRERCRMDLALGLKTYFAGIFKDPFSDDHMQIIAKMQLIIVNGGKLALAMPRGFGKALALDTPIITPDGWSTMGELSVGDQVFDELGQPCNVTFATETMLEKKCFRVAFDDGESVVCDAEHLWTVNDRFSRKNPLTLTTEEMAPRVVLSEKRDFSEYRYTIPLCEELQFPEASDLHVSPYILGAWLGDGSSHDNHITIGDADIANTRELIERHESLSVTCQRKEGSNCGTYLVGAGTPAKSLERVQRGKVAEKLLTNGVAVTEISRKSGLSVKTIAAMKYLGHARNLSVESVSLRARLKWLGVLNNKHIPKKYLMGSSEQRIELLRGLLDTDGTISKRGHVEYCTKLESLRDGVMELLTGLGFKSTYITRTVKGRPYYRICFTPSDGRRVFGLDRKAARQVRRSSSSCTNRRIVSIEPTDSVPVRCIQVDSPNNLYLCGKGMIPTHNTSLVECLAILAVLYGFQRYVVIIGASADAAKGISKSIRDELEDNPLLLEDFPEAVYPLVCLDGEPRRCLGQTYKGEKTRTEWGQMQIKFPTIPGSLASGAMIRAAGITGQIRGKKGKVKNEDATIEIFRPSLAIIDDPQTESSALSDVQCRNRERVINQSILGLAGKKVNIAAIMPCTVIRKGDVADRHLDHKIRPEWNGSRFKMLYAWPSNLALWDEYKEIRLSFNPAIPGEMEQAETRATEFYIDNQAAMDAGARVAWEYAFRSNEVSAIQSAMNRHIDDPRGFAAECQQEPLPDENDGVAPLTAKEIAGKLNGLPRGHVPHTATHVTVAIDVQKDVLFWMAVAWETDTFTGYVVDYGSWPDQGRVYYRKADLTRTIAKETKVQGLEGQIYAALNTLVSKIAPHSFPHGDGGRIRVSKILIDANYGDSTNTVYKFCLESPYAALLLPIHGKGIGATGRPMSQWQKKPGEVHDRNGQWIITKDAKRREIRYGLTDTNAWKSFIYHRLAVAPGNPGCLTLWGKDATLHQLVADHIASEYPIEVTAKGATITEWKLKPNADNDFFDTLCYNAAAASMAGVTLPSVTMPKPQGPQRVSFKEMQERARAKKLA